MMTELTNVSKKSLLTVCLVSLISCGGGGGGGGDSDDDSNTTQNFDFLDESGIWRLTANSMFNSDDDLTIGPDTVNIVSMAEAEQIIVVAFDNSGSQLVQQDCDAEGPIEVDKDEFSDEFFDDEDLDLDCDDETQEFVKVSDSRYTVEYSCDDRISVSLDFVKLSDQAEFDFGNLAFTSVMHDALSTDSGVCGTLTEGTGSQTVTPQPNNLNIADSTTPIHLFSVMAPYDGSFISIEFEFASDILPKAYSIDTEEVEVRLTSIIYGGTADDPENVSADSGTVTVTSMGEFSAAGTFNLITEEGDVMAGSFDFDIQ